MLSPSTAFFTIFAINCLAVLLFLLNHYNNQSSIHDLLREEPKSYSFSNPVVAYQVLKEFDIYEPNEYSPSKSSSANPFVGLIAEDNYCDKHRAYFANHASEMFEEMNFVTTHWANSPFRTAVIPQIGNDLQPEISTGMDESLKTQPLFNLKPNANIIFTFERMFMNRQIGKQFSCLSQASNHIPGHESLYRKDMIGYSLVNYAKKYSSKPQCFNFDKFFPKTWVLNDKEQCQEFFAEFNSPAYTQIKEEKQIVYLRKVGSGSHGGTGVFLVDNSEESYVRRLYNNGILCGQVDASKSNNVMQYFVHNPLLINGRKFDFRVFMLVASSNPFITFYHDGYLRLSLHQYNPDSKERGALLTNTALSKPLFKLAEKKGTYQGMTAEQLKEDSVWNFTQFQDHLNEQRLIKDQNWLNNYLRPELKKAMVHLVRMAQGPFLRTSSVFELYGLDFMMDTNLDLWFIEANAKPLLRGWTDETNRFFADMLVDQFDIIFGLLRSRMKRVVNFVNKLVDEDQVVRTSPNKVFIFDYENRVEEFNSLIQNRFEKEFLPRQDNKFSKIVDENYFGSERYSGILEDECM